MRLYRDQWRVPGVVPKMPPVDEVREECRARIGASVRFARGANAPYIAEGLKISYDISDEEWGKFIEMAKFVFVDSA